jgi:hypothetical protein
VLVVWLVTCVGGLLLLWRYKARPGDPGAPPARWPSPPGLALATDHPTLVMSVHPRCACTRASLAELEHVLAGAPGVTAYVLFVIPPGEAPGWERGGLWDRANAMPHVHAIADRDGALSVGAFRLAVSGHVLVYGTDGALRFSGGITPARGHEGDSIGRERVAAVLADETPDAATSHVFGCALEAKP